MAIIDVKLEDKDELTVPAVGGDIMYIKRKSAGGGFSITDYKIKVSNLVSNYLSYASDGVVPDAVAGTSYFNTNTNEFRGYDGTVWYNLLNRFVKVTLSAAEIKGIGTIPKTLVLNAGAGTLIHPTSVFARLNWNSIPFDNNGLNIGFTGAGGDIFTLASFINGTSNNLRTADMVGVSANNLTENVSLSVSGTDSTATGDSTVDIYITYETVIL